MAPPRPSARPGSSGPRRAARGRVGGRGRRGAGSGGRGAGSVPPLPRWSAGERGQASVEHAALVAVVLLVLAAATAVAAGLSGAGVANAVHSGVRRAICVAGGDDCAAFHVQQPCAVAWEEDSRSQGVSLGIWRIARDRSVAVERRSDGSALVTSYDGLEGGVGVSTGLRLGIGRRSGGEGPFSATVGAEGRLRGGWGHSWELPDGPSTRALVRRLAAREPVRPPDVERIRIGADAGVSGEVSGPLGLKASGSVLQGLRGEGTRDRRTGRTTVSLALTRGVTGDLAGPLGLKAGGAVQLEPSATLVTDRDLRPRELRLAGTLTTRDGSRRRDFGLRVDLTRPGVAEGIRVALRSLVSVDADGARAAAVELGRRAAEEGWIDVREHRGFSSTEGFEGELALGARLGAHDLRTHAGERLVSARTRPPGGLWEDRTDCVGPR